MKVKRLLPVSAVRRRRGGFPTSGWSSRLLQRDLVYLFGCFFFFFFKSLWLHCVEGTEAMSCNVNVDTQVCSAALARCDCHCVCGDERTMHWLASSRLQWQTISRVHLIFFTNEKNIVFSFNVFILNSNWMSIRSNLTHWKCPTPTPCREGQVGWGWMKTAAIVFNSHDTAAN